MFPVLGSLPSSLFKRSFASLVSFELHISRTKEEAILRKFVQDHARVIFLTGPIFVGKRTLALNVLKKISTEDKRPFIQFDSILKSSKDSAFSMFKNGHRPISQWDEWLRELSNSYSKQSSRPIVYLDQPEQILSSKAPINRSFCEWIAECSKRNHSDFILRFEQGGLSSNIRSLFNQSDVTTFDLGHLTKEEALGYWSKLIQKEGSRWPEVVPPLFEEAYSVCEGSLRYLKLYCLDYYQSKGNLKPDQFVPVQEERKKLVRLFFEGKDKREIASGKSFFGSPPDLTELTFEKKWTREQLSILLKMISCSKSLTYEKACLVNQLGIKFINRMIEEKVVVLSYVHQESTLCPYIPPTRFAIELFLNDLTSGKLKE